MTTKIWVFDTFEDADRARDAAISDGFSREDIVFSNRQEEAGPVEGNWMLPPVDSRHDEKEGFFHSLVADSDEATESYAKTAVTQRGNFLITVSLEDDRRLGDVDAVMRRHHGVDIDDRTPHR